MAGKTKNAEMEGLSKVIWCVYSDSATKDMTGCDAKGIKILMTAPRLSIKSFFSYVAPVMSIEIVKYITNTFYPAYCVMMSAIN